MKNHRTEKEKTLGQFFTKECIIEKLLNVLFEYRPFSKDIKILEPSFGTGNFIRMLEKSDFKNVEGCEIDPTFTNKPINFFNYPTQNKYDLIIGNPPFTKYNIKQSYYYLSNCEKTSCSPEEYLPKQLFKKEKEKIENIFILKSLKHLKDKNSIIAFILPISFFIKNKNKLIKKELQSSFSTIIIYQNKETWFNYSIPCCFAIFANIRNLENKIILCFENDHKHKEILNITSIFEEIIPEVFYNKKYGLINNHNGNLLKNYLSNEKIKYLKSFETNNVSAKNILENNRIPTDEDVEDYKLAVVRVGNASVGRCGLINVKKDVLNDMFFVFDFIKEYTRNKDIKERTCELINSNPDYFQNVTCRVGSKSIKKEDVYNFKADL